MMKKLPFLVLLALNPCLFFAQNVGILPNVLWRRQFGDDRFDHRYQHAVASTNKLYIALQRRPAGDFNGTSSPWVWEVNEQGELGRAVPIERTNESVEPRTADIDGIATLEDGSLSAAVDLGKGAPVLVRLTGSKLTSPSNEKSDFTKQIIVFKMFQTADRNILFLGTNNRKPFIMKVNPDGEKIWEQNFSLDLSGAILDGLPTDNGGAILVGDFWGGDPFFMGKSSVWVAMVDAKGTVQNNKTYPGRRPGVARGIDVGYVVVYDEGDSVSQRIRLQAFTGNLEGSWSATVLNAERGLATFRIVSVPKGGFIIVGSDDLKLWVSRVGLTGKEIWTVSEPQTDSSDFDLVSSGDRVFIVYTVVHTYMEKSRRKLNNKVGVIAFSVQ